MSVTALSDDSHIRETVETLEAALVDAKAGRLSAVVVFADLRGEAAYKKYKSALPNAQEMIGRLITAAVDIVLDGRKL